MAHRLLHTLVFSSTVLLDGCALSHDRVEPAASGDAAVSEAAASDAAMPSDAGVDAPDPRWCEPGWPTTKGTWQLERDGLTYSCSLDVDRDDPDLAACCVVPAP